MSDNINVYLKNESPKDLSEEISGVVYFLPASSEKGAIDKSGKIIPICLYDAKTFCRRNPRVVKILDGVTLESAEGIWVYHRSDMEKTVHFGGTPQLLPPFESKCFPVETARHFIRHSKEGDENIVFEAGPESEDEFLVTPDMKREDLYAFAKEFDIPYHVGFKNKELAFRIMDKVWTKRLHEKFNKEDIERFLEEFKAERSKAKQAKAK